MFLKKQLQKKVRWISRVLFGLGFLSILYGTHVPIVQATVVGGLIDLDTTWTLVDSPYIVSTSVLVLEDVTLTIEPGVVVEFASHKALQIQGELIAQGTENLPILFTSNSEIPEPGDWDYILFTDSSDDAIYDLSGNYLSGSILEFVVIEYGGGASVENNAALRLDSAGPFINETSVILSSSHAIRYWSYSGNVLKITHCTIAENAGNGIYVQENNYIEISNTLIKNNGIGGLAGQKGSAVYIQNGEVVFNNNTILGNVTGYGSSAKTTVYIYATPLVFTNNVIAENKIYDCSWCWAEWTISVGSQSADISHNLIINNDNSGIYASVTGTIANNVISDNGGNGIYLRGYSYSGLLGYLFEMTHNTILRNNYSAPNDSANGVTYFNGFTDIGNIISYNTILGNTNTGDIDPRAFFILYGNPQITLNNIYGNNGYALYNDMDQGTSLLNAENNWWGTTTSSEISSLIYDWFDDTSKSIVDFSPYLTDLNIDAPISPPSGVILTPTPSSFLVDWSANLESDVVGYKIYYDTDPGYPFKGTGADQGDSPIDVGDVNTFSITGLEQDTRYYFAITAYDTNVDGLKDQTDGNESWFSLEQIAGMGESPTALFSGTPGSGPSPLDVLFINESIGDYSTCHWDFGDDSFSDICTPPIHSYLDPWVYTVELTVSGLAGFNSLSLIDYITVYTPASADFSGTPTSGVAPLLVDFINLSSGDFTNCEWDFGDGDSNTGCSDVSHTYQHGGIYTVTLTVSGLGGTDFLSKTNYIDVWYSVFLPMVLLN